MLFGEFCAIISYNKKGETMTPKKTLFEVTNDQTGKTILIDSDANLKSMQRAMDVTAAEMLAKAEKETNPAKKAMMMKYVKRMTEIETQFPGYHEMPA